jgi:benzoyl-CoA reductase/2-hydroxyglutaryl-CoA dehydratase subunit BcrC/BadD/HgdB
MGLTPYGLNIQEAIRSTDQRNSIYYLDACTEYGIPLDTCSFPQIGTGAALRGDYIEGFPCALMSNLTCDPALAGYNLVEKILDVPAFYFDHPYRFKSPGGHVSFAKQMRDMIAFLEKHTRHTLDYDMLKLYCERYNQMQEMEIERWEHNYGPKPPIPGDLLLNIHLKLFGPYAGTEEGLNIMRRQLELTREAAAKGEAGIPNQQYRVVLWNPPPGSYWNFSNWIGQCWGVNILNDMETFGNFQFIDTSSEEALFDTLGAKSMYYTMSRHTRGDMTNFFDDLFKLCELSKPDFIIQADHIGCHPVNTVRGMLNEECQRHGVKLLRFENDLGDVRVTSHQKVRDQVNSFMTNVMNATPLKPELLTFDDSSEW